MVFYELVSYNQRLHKKSIKSSRWQGSLLIRWLQRHIMGLFCYLLGGFRALKISSFGQLYCGHHKAWWRESRDWLLHQDVYSLSTAFLMAVMMMVWIQSHAKELLVHSPNHEKIPSEERELDVKPIMSSFASMNSKFFFTVDEILDWEHLLCA